MRDLPERLLNDLNDAASSMGGIRIERLFTTEPDRLDQLTVEAAGIALDLSKNQISLKALNLLFELAEALDLKGAISDLLSGVEVNNTEQRPALHSSLRMAVAGLPDVPHCKEILEAHALLSTFVGEVLSGTRRGFDGRAFTDVVNIGIGGSHLGPRLACDAMRYERQLGPNAHFLANVDGGEFDRILSQLNPATTLFIVASKSFSTVETTLNATSAREWLLEAADDASAVASHFIAVSANIGRAVDFGIEARNVYPMWDWVGGRYSMWSAISLPIALCYGMDAFDDLLAGAAEMDQHFASADATRNLPVLLALVSAWHSSFLGADSYAVVPYDDRLRYLPDYLQQLEMESNGKGVTMEGSAVNFDTAPVTWGGLGTNAQHAFFQLLHQGTRFIPVDFIVALTHPAGRGNHHDLLVANCLAQSEGLLRGRKVDGDDGQSERDLGPHRSTPGNRPSTTISVESLTPATLGSLIALYEHKTYVQSVLWQINAFDQWGVELGKQLADGIVQELEQGRGTNSHDPSTNALIERYLAARG